MVRQRSDAAELPSQDVSKTHTHTEILNIFSVGFDFSLNVTLVSSSPRAADVQTPRASSLAPLDPFLGTPITRTSKLKSR